MNEIVDVHFPGIKKKLVAEALRIFYDMRKVPGLKKKPSTSELLDWLKLLLVEDIDEEALRERDPDQADPAAARRPAQERAGRAPVRAPGLPRPPRSRRRAAGAAVGDADSRLCSFPRRRESIKQAGADLAQADRRPIPDASVMGSRLRGNERMMSW